jgi:hypothetical protein
MYHRIRLKPTNLAERNAAAKHIKNLVALKSDRYEFAAFLDDIAMCVNAGVIEIDVANYSFGYYARQLFPSRGDYEESSNSKEQIEVDHEWAKKKGDLFWTDLYDEHWCVYLNYSSKARG